jgi:hypothetical protein
MRTDVQARFAILPPARLRGDRRAVLDGARCRGAAPAEHRAR